MKTEPEQDHFAQWGGVRIKLQGNVEYEEPTHIPEPNPMERQMDRITTLIFVIGSIIIGVLIGIAHIGGE
jgi:hypothetical protein